MLVREGLHQTLHDQTHEGPHNDIRFCLYYRNRSGRSVTPGGAKGPHYFIIVSNLIKSNQIKY